MAIAAMYCKKCGYDLRGQQAAPGYRCPECGRQFDPGDKWTYRRRPLRELWTRWAKRAAATSIVIAITLAASWAWLYWGWKSEQRALAEMGTASVYREPLGPRTLHGYLGPFGWVLNRVTKINFGNFSGSRANVPDAALRSLKDFQELQSLDFRYTNFTDAGLEHLKGLTGLQELHLGDTPVTDAGLVNLRELKGLYSLDLNNTRVTDAGLANLKGLKALRDLYLMNTQVTAAGLEQLKDLHDLLRLVIEGTRVMPSEIKRVRALWPSASIITE